MTLLELKVISLSTFKNKRSRNTFQWLLLTVAFNLESQNIQSRFGWVLGILLTPSTSRILLYLVEIAVSFD